MASRRGILLSSTVFALALVFKPGSALSRSCEKLFSDTQSVARLGSDVNELYLPSSIRALFPSSKFDPDVPRIVRQLFILSAIDAAKFKMAQQLESRNYSIVTAEDVLTFGADFKLKPGERLPPFVERAIVAMKRISARPTYFISPIRFAGELSNAIVSPRSIDRRIFEVASGVHFTGPDGEANLNRDFVRTWVQEASRRARDSRHERISARDLIEGFEATLLLYRNEDSGGIPKWATMKNLFDVVGDQYLKRFEYTLRYLLYGTDQKQLSDIDISTAWTLIPSHETPFDFARPSDSLIRAAFSRARQLGYKDLESLLGIMEVEGLTMNLRQDFGGGFFVHRIEFGPTGPEVVTTGV